MEEGFNGAGLNEWWENGRGKEDEDPAHRVMGSSVVAMSVSRLP